MKNRIRIQTNKKQILAGKTKKSSWLKKKKTKVLYMLDKFIV